MSKNMIKRRLTLQTTFNLGYFELRENVDAMRNTL